MNKDRENTSQNRATAYVRNSTEHQQCSTTDQVDVIREYAQRHELEIVKIYADHGKAD